MRDLKDRPFHGVIKEFDHWIVLFGGRQVTIVSLVIMSKDLSKASLDSVAPEAWAEFGVVTGSVEDVLSRAFGAEKFNYLALMMVDLEVHFHVISRYSRPVAFMGREFVDPDWPGVTKRIAMELEQEVLDAIKSRVMSFV